jgi:hypothetical protein
MLGFSGVPEGGWIIACLHRCPVESVFKDAYERAFSGYGRNDHCGLSAGI